MYRYETHLHTKPISRCAHATVRECLEFYKSQGYQGVFISNHFIHGNIGIDHSAPYEDRIRFFFSDSEEAIAIGRELGIDVFIAMELAYKGTDFLVYGPDMDFFLAHPEYETMTVKQRLTLLAESGALIVHAHPYREAGYIDYIRLLPRHVHGVEVYNANRNSLENGMAAAYAEAYNLIPFAGTDNHVGGAQRHFGGMESERPIRDMEDFIRLVKEGKMTPFRYDIED